MKRPPKRRISDRRKSHIPNLKRNQSAHRYIMILPAMGVISAEALEEIDPKIQKSLIEDISVEKASDIVEETSPSDCCRSTGRLAGGSGRGDPRRDGKRLGGGSEGTPCPSRRNSRRVDDHRLPHRDHGCLY